MKKLLILFQIQQSDQTNLVLKDQNLQPHPEVELPMRTAIQTGSGTCKYDIINDISKIHISCSNDTYIGMSQYIKRINCNFSFNDFLIC